MTVSFVLLGVITLASAVLAMTLRNLVHCALCLAITFAGLAGFYLQLQAQFVGFAQILVYVGAVAILIVFAILLTRGSEPPTQPLYTSNGWIGVAIGFVVFAVIAAIIFSSKVLDRPASATPEISVRQLGDQLMRKYVLPLEVLGLLLTAALIGAVILAMQESGPAQHPEKK
jgi:NADH-quinone oxidoreductase subunit J